MDVLTLQQRALATKPRQRDSGFRPQGELETAIERSQAYLLSQQKPEGYWVGELMVDATIVADTIAYHHWNGKVDEQWQRKAVNHIFSRQLPDGGWNIYYGGPAEVNATIKCYLALKLAGVPVTDPRMLRAREVALSLGGVPRMNTFSKLYLALLGLFPWDYVPTIPCEVILIGKWFYVNFNEMSSWSRSMLVPLAIINSYKPTRPLKNNIKLNELFPEGIHERDLAVARDPERLTWRNFFLWLDRVHKFAEWFAEHRIHPFRKRALKKAEQWMLERFEGSDGLAAIFPAMLNSLIALKALGYPDNHPQVLRAERELKKLEHETEWSVRIEPCFSPVWDSAIVTICLHESGLPSDHPALKRCAEWLIGEELRFRGDWHYKNRAKVEASGWVFEFANKWNPDVDDTAMVLLALRKVPTDDRRKRDECFQRGLKWMLTFQCKDGGWGERCNTYDDPVFKGQGPSTASQTAWAVMGLCAFDDPQRPSIRRGIEYLVRTQNEDGSWTEHETTGTGFPKVFYLKYDMYRNSWPLLALATYRKLLEALKTSP